jgi:hypothetical protein
MVERIVWTPGNETRYDLAYVESEGIIYLTWLLFGGSGGKTFAFSRGTFVHWAYLAEKMDLRESDAAGLLAFLFSRGHDVGMPEGYHAFPGISLLQSVN